MCVHAGVMTVVMDMLLKSYNMGTSSVYYGQPVLSSLCSLAYVNHVAALV